MSVIGLLKDCLIWPWKNPVKLEMFDSKKKQTTLKKKKKKPKKCAFHRFKVHAKARTVLMPDPISIVCLLM